MTVKRICPQHGAYAARRCPTCAQDRATRPKPLTQARMIRNTARWHRARDRALDRDQHRCTYGLEHGEHFWMPDGRCPVTDGVDVHHRTPIEDGGAPFDDRNLRTLCSTHHHRKEEEHRRAKRDEVPA